MKFFFRGFILACLILASIPQKSSAQYTVPAGKKNHFIFNLGQYLVNEINLGYERKLAPKRSLEINGGLIYRNDFFIRNTEEWTNSQYFYEHGFSVRVGYKIFMASDGTRQRDYVMPMLNYQYLYFPDAWFETEVKVKDSVEEIYQHRFRNRIGLQFVWGKIFPMGDAFAIELFYGAGIRAVMTNRYDVARRYTGAGSETVFPINFRDKSFYFRPSVHAGVKLRLGW